jgi:hypothetical protein
VPASKYIATKLHQALELAGDDPDWLARVDALPHYVIDPTLAGLLSRSDLASSLTAMHEADIANLPFPELCLEMDGGQVRFFFLLEEYQHRFRARVAALHPSGVLEIDPHPMMAEIVADGIAMTAPRSNSHPAWVQHAAVAVGVALMMMSIQGIEKQVLYPTKLNQARTAKGRPPVPRHTLLRVGHVYDTEGRRVGVGGPTGRHMAIHLRASHNRMQVHGPDNSLRKLINVPAVLVNFHPGAEIRQPKRIVAA